MRTGDQKEVSFKINKGLVHLSYIERCGEFPITISETYSLDSKFSVIKSHDMPSHEEINIITEWWTDKPTSLQHAKDFFTEKVLSRLLICPWLIWVLIHEEAIVANGILRNQVIHPFKKRGNDNFPKKKKSNIFQNKKAKIFLFLK